MRLKSERKPILCKKSPLWGAKISGGWSDGDFGQIRDQREIGVLRRSLEISDILEISCFGDLWSCLAEDGELSDGRAWGHWGRPKWPGVGFYPTKQTQYFFSIEIYICSATKNLILNMEVGFHPSKPIWYFHLKCMDAKFNAGEEVSIKPKTDEAKIRQSQKPIKKYLPLECF